MTKRNKTPQSTPRAVHLDGLLQTQKESYESAGTTIVVVIVFLLSVIGYLTFRPYSKPNEYDCYKESVKYATPVQVTEALEFGVITRDSEYKRIYISYKDLNKHFDQVNCEFYDSTRRQSNE